MSDDDLAVSVASFERTGMVGAFNRYRAVALDTEESADIVGAWSASRRASSAARTMSCAG